MHSQLLWLLSLSPPLALHVSFNMDASTSYPGHKLFTVLVQEGGVGFINYLLALAISPDDSSLLPTVSWVREWHFQDILKFPKREMKEWKIACCEELESLHQHKVFELCNLPHGRKVVCNCWVFDIKPNHYKKAQLVAEDFSQKQSIDYNEIFCSLLWDCENDVSPLCFGRLAHQSSRCKDCFPLWEARQRNLYRATWRF